MLPPHETQIWETAATHKEAAIRIMHARGYRMHPDGFAMNPGGEPLSARCEPRKCYPEIAISMNGHTIRVRLHRFAAFCYFGEAIFTPGLVVRHLQDRHDCRDGRLALGTQTENEHDKPVEQRQRVARLARAAQRRPANAKLSPQQLGHIRRHAGITPIAGVIRTLAVRYGVKERVIRDAIKGVTYGRNTAGPSGRRPNHRQLSTGELREAFSG